MPGLPLVRASCLREASELMSEDFPTFERPIKAISVVPSVGRSFRSKTDFVNSGILLTRFFSLVLDNDIFSDIVAVGWVAVEAWGHNSLSKQHHEYQYSIEAPFRFPFENPAL